MSSTILDHNAADGQGDDLPPQDLDAEQSVLGAMMLSKSAITEVAELIKPEHFYRPTHQAIYAAILDMYVGGEPVDAITLSGTLERRRELAKVGGAPYLHTLIATVPTAANAGYYAESVLDKADLRKLRETGGAMTAHALNPGVDVNEMLDRAQNTLADAIEFRSGRREGGKYFGDLLQATFDEMDLLASGGRQGISTGFTDLDKVTNGLHAGQMVTVAGRPGTGKSVLASDFVRAAAMKQGKGAVVFNLEMSESELMMRLISAESRVRLDDMRGGRMSDEDWARMAKKTGELADAPLVVDVTPTLTPVEMMGRARKHKREMEANGIELGIIVVDYLQLISIGGKRAENRQQEVSDISRAMKIMAKELGVPVVALSQLNREVEQRSDKKPQLSDLRESGSLEQDSDMVILIHRPDAYDRDDPRMGEVDFILAKHRNGPTMTITAAHQLHYSRFVDMAKE